jgi:predicted kinase
MAQVGHSVPVADATNDRDERRPTLVLVTGLPGTGKSTAAEAAAEVLGL